MTQSTPAILGAGYSLPPTIRGNDDPIFDWLRSHHPKNLDLFTGLKTRHVLHGDESIATNMVEAAHNAMTMAGVRPNEIDGITGYMSNSEYLTPNGLAQVHATLELRRDSWCHPVSDNFTNFLTGLSHAHDAVASGRAKYVLVVCGCNWSRMVDYHTAQAITAADGAGAVVVGASTDAGLFRLVDQQVFMQTESYGSMYLRNEPVLPDGAPPYHQPTAVYTAPYFTLTKAGATVFQTFGKDRPVEVANELLRRNHITGADITLSSYQVSAMLNGYWESQIKPAATIDTLEELGNMTLASIPVDFAKSYGALETDWLLAFSMNVSVGVGAVLLRRNA